MRFEKGNKLGNRFEKGFTPWNKGMKGFETSGTFKKGTIPWNKGKETGLAPWLGKKRPSLVKSGAKKTMFKKGSAPWNKGLKDVYSLNYKGPKNHMWKGGVTPINKIIRRSIEFKNWRGQVFKRDNWTCQLCGKMGVELHPNHIKKFADYPELRFELANGITLCSNCHFKLVNNHEGEWESYFNFDLETRGYIGSDLIPTYMEGVMPYGDKTER